jgi:hypothetical protein
MTGVTDAMDTAGVGTWGTIGAVGSPVSFVKFTAMLPEGRKPMSSATAPVSAIARTTPRMAYLPYLTLLYLTKFMNFRNQLDRYSHPVALLRHTRRDSSQKDKRPKDKLPKDKHTSLHLKNPTEKTLNNPQ